LSWIIDTDLFDSLFDLENRSVDGCDVVPPNLEFLIDFFALKISRKSGILLELTVYYSKRGVLVGVNERWLLCSTNSSKYSVEGLYDFWLTFGFCFFPDKPSL